MTPGLKPRASSHVELKAWRNWRKLPRFAAAVFLVAVVAPAPGHGEAKGAASAKVGGAAGAGLGPPKAAVQPLAELTPKGSLAAQYCEAVRDAAGEARFAFQVARLEGLARELDDRIAKLETRSAELKQWLARREEFTRRATEQLVGIFSAMRPEAASEQLVSLDPFTAAAIVSRLDARTASAILNDMPADRAAGLAAILVGAAKRERGEGKP